jgi:hypothetical protein
LFNFYRVQSESANKDQAASPSANHRLLDSITFSIGRAVDPDPDSMGCLDPDSDSESGSRIRIQGQEKEENEEKIFTFIINIFFIF